MGKYLIYWRKVETAPWPTDPTEALKLNEMMWAAMDNKIKSGEVKEIGWFVDGTSGYVIAEGDSTDALRSAAMFGPFIEWADSEEIVPWETGKEVFRGVMKAQAEQMAAMKR